MAASDARYTVNAAAAGPPAVKSWPLSVSAKECAPDGSPGGDAQRTCVSFLWCAATTVVPKRHATPWRPWRTSKRRPTTETFVPPAAGPDAGQILSTSGSS